MLKYAFTHQRWSPILWILWIVSDTRQFTPVVHSLTNTMNFANCKCWFRRECRHQDTLADTFPTSRPSHQKNKLSGGNTLPRSAKMFFYLIAWLERVLHLNKMFNPHIEEVKWIGVLYTNTKFLQKNYPKRENCVNSDKFCCFYL